jgi:hypothetical protein
VSKYEDPDEYPLTQAVCWTKLPAGWVISYIEIQGNEILHTEALSTVPEKSKPAGERLAVEAAAKFAAAVNTRGLRS